MSISVPLPITPWPLSDERLQLLKQAKASLNLPYLIVPVEWHPGSPGRPLCFGAMPDAISKTAPIRPENVDSVASIAAALQFALTAPPSDPRFDEAHWLSQVMGCEVVYSHTEVDGEVVFYDG